MNTEHADFAIVNQRYEELLRLTTAPYVLKLPASFKHLWPLLYNVGPNEQVTYRFKHARVVFEPERQGAEAFRDMLADVRTTALYHSTDYQLGVVRGMEIAGRLLGVIE